MLNLIGFILNVYKEHSFLPLISSLVVDSNSVKSRNGYQVFV